MSRRLPEPRIALLRSVARPAPGNLSCFQRRHHGLAPSVLSVCVSVSAYGVELGGGHGGVTLVPNASIGLTLTDNHALSGVDPESDMVTRLSAGIGMSARSGMLRGFLDYRLSQLAYARHSGQNTHQNDLSAALSAYLMDERAQVDVRASVSQGAISPFGAQPVNGGLPGANSTEVRSLSIAPALNGFLGPALRYNAGLSASASSAASTSVGDSTATSVNLRITPRETGRFGWALDASRLASHVSDGRGTVDDRVYATGTFQWPEWDIQMRASGGTESTDLAASGRLGYRTWSLGVAWVPSPRTRIDADVGDRFFGKSHSLSMEHRTALTVWRISDSRSVTVPGAASAAGNRGTVFDLYFAQFASIEPDLVKRADLVNAFLGRLGIDPKTGDPASFLSSAATVDDRQILSVAMRGARSSATLSVFRSRSHGADPSSSLAPGLAVGSEVSQRGLSLDLAHRLTPTSSMNVGFSEQRSSGNASGQGNRQRLFNLTYATQLGVRGSLDLGMRRSAYSAASLPYGETAVFASYGLRF